MIELALMKLNFEFISLGQACVSSKSFILQTNLLSLILFSNNTANAQRSKRKKIWTYQQMKKKSKIDGLEIWDLKSVYFELIFLCYFLLTNNYCCGKNKLEEIKNRLLEIKIGFVEVKIAGKFEVVNGLTS